MTPSPDKHIVLKVGGRPLLAPPNYDRLDVEFLRQVCELSQHILSGGIQRLTIVPGGAGSHLFVEPARSLNASEVECDQIGIAVIEIIARLFLAGLKQIHSDIYPRLVTCAELLDDAARKRISVVAPGSFSAISSDSLAALVAEHCKARLVLVKRTLKEDVYPLIQNEDDRRFLRISDLITEMQKKPAMASQHPFMDVLSLKIIERSRIRTSVVFRNDFLKLSKGNIDEVLNCGLEIRQ